MKAKMNPILLLLLKKTIIITYRDTISLLSSLFSYNPDIKIYFLSNSKEVFDANININYLELKPNQYFNDEITKFNENLPFIRSNNLWFIIKSCISGYFIQESYLKLNKDRVLSYISHQNKPIENKTMTNEDYFELRSIISIKYGIIKLVYQVEYEEILIMKIFQDDLKDESFKYAKRELDSYSIISHPFLPKFYGKSKDEKSLFIEYINGQTLLDIKSLKLTEHEKYTIILQLLSVFKYIHEKSLIYCDLKPDNVMIDENKNLVLIDFDRMTLKYPKNEERTKDFASCFIAPETNSESLTEKSDIYSIGLVIYYIINEDYIINEELKQFANFKGELEIKKICNKCCNANAEEIPSISTIIEEFYDFIVNKKIVLNHINTEDLYQIGLLFLKSENYLKAIDYFTIASNQNYSEAQYKLGKIYSDEKYAQADINKSIYYYTLASNLNITDAQNNLGVIYYDNKYNKQDINKSIYYFSLASDQNHVDAQYNLGIIYYDNKYNKQDISKSIYYFSLASDQNDIKAQYNLGVIYYDNKYIKQDISKSIRYFSLAADQNYEDAQCILGVIFYEGKYIARDMNKSINYLSLVADKNHANAQYYLGLVYYCGVFIQQDINKSLFYFTLALNQNHAKSQYYLGKIYCERKYVKQDISKTIYYLSLSSNQNNKDALYTLGCIYYRDEFNSKNIAKAIDYFSKAANQNHEIAQYYLRIIYYNGKYVKIDINKSIFYFELASNNNFSEAQFYLGMIYCKGKYIQQDINKSINYYTLAANQNHSKSQYNLALIYYENDNIEKSIYYFSLTNDPNALFNIASIYYEGKYVKRNIDKSIHFYTLSAKQNNKIAQHNLGVLYYENVLVPRDIVKSIEYLTLSSNQNYIDSQYLLGIIYHAGKYVKRDIKKAIQYFTLTSNQKHSESQYCLGVIYYDGKYVTRDIKEAIHYFILASNQNYSQAQFSLGLIYYEGKYITQDINKSIHYFTLAADQNHSTAQFYLGIIYLDVIFIPDKNIIKNVMKSNNTYIFYFDNLEDQIAFQIFFKEDILINQHIYLGIHLIMKSSTNGNKKAHFSLECLYHEGKYIKQDIKKAISLYKEASSFNIHYAKNNLGIIYKNGFGNSIKKNIENAKIYFVEAINQKEDPVSMYNISHIYIYEEPINQSIDLAIYFLIESSRYFYPSTILLCIALIIKHKTNISEIREELKNKDYLLKTIKQINEDHMLYIPSKFNDLYKYYKNIDYFINPMLKPYPSLELNSQINFEQREEFRNKCTIDSQFYDGLGNCFD